MKDKIIFRKMYKGYVIEAVYEYYYESDFGWEFTPKIRVRGLDVDVTIASMPTYEFGPNGEEIWTVYVYQTDEIPKDVFNVACSYINYAFLPVRFFKTIIFRRNC